MVLVLAHRNVGRVARTNFFKVMFRVKFIELLTLRSLNILLHPCRGVTR